MRISDWSSDVCSSDLYRQRKHRAQSHGPRVAARAQRPRPKDLASSQINRTDPPPWRLLARHLKRRKEAVCFHRIRSEEHTSELQSLMRISYAVFCLKKKTKRQNTRKQDISRNDR